MKRILEVLESIADTVIFIMYDNTTEYGLTKEERIALMDEYRQKEETARAQKGEKDRALRAARESYMATEEYISAGEAEKIWIIVKYGIILDNRGELRFDELKKQWIYSDGKSKTKLIIVDHFDENGKTFSELLLSALVYEADQMEKSAKADEKNNGKENE